AEVYERMGEPDIALKNYKTARMYNPANPDICVRLGRLYYDKGELEKSAEVLQAAVELSPDWSVPHYWLARVYERLGEGDRAKLHLRKLKELAASRVPDK
ncbi:MAG: tetratricopeptide repeat protein, partial [Candidatus Abyssobacteria bacterium SURF_17]